MTHAFFSHEEWVTIKNEDMFFEDGSSCSQNQFWADRRSREWLFNWSEWKELKQNDKSIIIDDLTSSIITKGQKQAFEKFIKKPLTKK